jgi:hypothetical protein
MVARDIEGAAMQRLVKVRSLAFDTLTQSLCEKPSATVCHGPFQRMQQASFISTIPDRAPDLKSSQAVLVDAHKILCLVTYWSL